MFYGLAEADGESLSACNGRWAPAQRTLHARTSADGRVSNGRYTPAGVQERKTFGNNNETEGDFIMIRTFLFV